ncbi:hypothetical protein CCR75_002320 [Bremia lactucae]|uniref:Uncharacterized protein n=1 Tax=Bremia lactucae TaxID=4779 RepID=A0A976IKT9_BRELC|nr:hypothetical protein CCR75_002320 [Bremia lactucae]
MKDGMLTNPPYGFACVESRVRWSINASSKAYESTAHETKCDFVQPQSIQYPHDSHVVPWIFIIILAVCL